MITETFKSTLTVRRLSGKEYYPTLKARVSKISILGQLCTHPLLPTLLRAGYYRQTTIKRRT